MSTPQDFWSQIKTNLTNKNASNTIMRSWFDPTDLVSIEDRKGESCFILGVPTELHKYWISQHLLDRICAEISALYSNPFQIELVVTGQTQSDLPQIEEKETRAPQAASSGIISPGGQRDTLVAEHSFSSFVVGRNNEFAHAASYNIAENPGTDGYNPLFICGPTGMGKTHLLNAVGNHLRQKYPHLKVMYVSAERFFNECITSVRRNEMDRFRQRYRHQCDVLLMDDIQIFGRGEAVQEEFFHTLNDFFEKGHQVIVASDRMPKDIQGLADRIRTRLEWGLIADIQMPDIETRVAILKYKAERKGIHLPNDVVSYVARISKRSIRELEGNLNKIKMFSELQGMPITMELVKKVLATHDDTATITIDDIQKLTADHFKVRVIDIKSKTRTKPLVTARQTAMYLVKKHLDKSLVDIGRAFGGKDHTTVLSALRKIEDQLKKNLEIKRDIEELEGRIHNITGL